MSTSDPQARVMHHSDGGLALSYNAQISADAAHGLIVGVAVTQEANDSAQLLPAVERIEERLKKKPRQMVADGGYTTRETLKRWPEREIDFLGSMRWEKMTSGATRSATASAQRVCLSTGNELLCLSGGQAARPKGVTRKRNGVWRSTATRPSCMTAKLCPNRVLPGKSKRGVRWLAAIESPAVRGLPPKDGRRRSASPISSSGQGGGILPRVDQEQARTATVSCARPSESTNGIAVGLPHL